MEAASYADRALAVSRASYEIAVDGDATQMFASVRSLESWASANPLAAGIAESLVAALIIAIVALVARQARDATSARSVYGEIISWRRNRVLKELQDLFGSDVRIRGVTLFEPHLTHLGEFEPSNEVAEKAAQLRASLRKNHNVGIVWSDSDLGANPPRVFFKTTDYAIAATLHNLGDKPLILSADTLVCCAEADCLFVHVRNERHNVERSKYHIFGGAYLHKTLDVGDDKGSIRKTAQREVFEETGINLKMPKKVLCLTTTEDPLGYIQFAHLGLNVRPEDVPSNFNDPEGEVLRVGFDELEDRLLHGDWVPSGRLAVLYWLACGAPLSSGGYLGRRRALRIYRNIVKRLPRPREANLVKA